MFAVTILRKKLISTQWMSLVFLIAGVVFVQLAASDGAAAATTSSSSSAQNPFLGLMAALGACVLSGFAGIYFEKILKGSDVSVWMRNVQLSLLSLPFGLITCLLNDGSKIVDHGFFNGYDFFIWYLIVLQAGGGLIVAVVVKYADNILKGFATSLAIIISCVASIYIFDFKLTLSFSFGAALVICSIFLYGYQPTTVLTAGTKSKSISSRNLDDEEKLLP